jgi:DNA-3-methyladenine glycosylase II
MEQAKLSAHSIGKAEVHLAERDPVMAGLIDQLGPCRLAAQPYRPFQTLANSIVSQQLSSKAAGSIKSRIRKVIGGQFSPSRVYSACEEDLQGAGLSRRKVTYIKELARRVLAKEIDFAKLRQSPTDHAVECLLEIPGVGPWTAHMFLIFGLKHPNVLALDDAGLRRATKLLYRNAELETVSERWHPYCSVASWYLWRHLDSQ